MPPATPMLNNNHTSQHQGSNTPPESFGMITPSKPSTAEQRPLFLPGSSQLSILDEKALRESGLGIENMTEEEFNDLLGEEVAPDFENDEVPDTNAQVESFELLDDGDGDEPMLAPTQRCGVSFNDQSRVSLFLVFGFVLLTNSN